MGNSYFAVMMRQISWGRWRVLGAVGAAGGATYDLTYGDQKVTRNVRTLRVALHTLVDYKFRLTATNLEGI